MGCEFIDASKTVQDICSSNVSNDFERCVNEFKL